jgi:hypothetical protein
MSFGIGFFFGFDNTPSQLMGDIWSAPAGGAPVIVPASPAASNKAATYAEDNTRREALLRHTVQGTIHAGIGSWYPAQGQLGPGQTGAFPRLK